jgi:acetyl-CoA carboxylase biotin carboxylase subunit
VRGHAIECRINAESPRDGFTPRPGRITAWEPPAGDHIRLDSHCEPGYLVPPYYDSMIGKLLVHGPDRATAVARMQDAVDRFRIEGIETNLDFHRHVLRHPDFVAARLNTKWLENVLLPEYLGR